MSTWYYISNRNERIGPLDDAALQQAIVNGMLLPDCLVFKVGSSEWSRARDFPDLRQYAATSNPPISVPFWSVKNIVTESGTWGCEIRFPGASVTESHALSGLLRQYVTIQSSSLPKVSITADRTGLLFLFPHMAGRVEAVLANAPFGDAETEALRLALLRVAEILHPRGLGLWTVDWRLLFQADGRYLVIPVIWLPAFAGREEAIPGAAPEWREAYSQPQADIYAVASACFKAVTSTEYDSTAQTLPGQIFPAAKGWDIVLAPGLQHSPSRRPERIGEWLRIKPSKPMVSTESIDGIPPTNAKQDFDLTEVKTEVQRLSQKNVELHVKIPVTLNQFRKKSGNTASRVKIVLFGILNRILSFINKRHSDVENEAGTKRVHQVTVVPPRTKIVKNHRLIHKVTNKTPFLMAGIPLCLVLILIWWFIGRSMKSMETVEDWLARQPIGIHEILTENYKITENCIIFAKSNLMCFAAAEGRVDVMEWLKEQGVSPTQEDSSWPPIMYAVRMNQIHALEWLKQNGVDVNAQSGISTAVHQAALFGAVEALQWLKNNGADLNVRDNKGCTIIFYGAGSGSIEILEWLKDNGVDITAKNEHGDTAMYWAASRNNVNVMQWLKENGVDPNERNEYGITAISSAIAFGSLAALEWLKDNGVDLNARDYDGNAAVHDATTLGPETVGNVDSMRWLLSNGADPNISNKNGLFPVHLAAGIADDIALLECLKDYGANINACDNKGNTPAHSAARHGSVKSLQWLKDNGANFDILNHMGQKAQDVANLGADQWFMDHMADAKIRRRNGRTTGAIPKTIQFSHLTITNGAKRLVLRMRAALGLAEFARSTTNNVTEVRRLKNRISELYLGAVDDKGVNEFHQFVDAQGFPALPIKLEEKLSIAQTGQETFAGLLKKNGRYDIADNLLAQSDRNMEAIINSTTHFSLSHVERIADVLEKSLGELSNAYSRIR